MKNGREAFAVHYPWLFNTETTEIKGNQGKKVGVGDAISRKLNH